MHTYLALDMSRVPQSTKDNVPTFALGLFSNEPEPTRMLLDGYRVGADGSYILDSEGEKVLCHSPKVLGDWLQWSANPIAVQKTLIDKAIEYTREEYLQLKAEPTSIWYVNPEENI